MRQHAEHRIGLVAEQFQQFVGDDDVPARQRECIRAEGLAGVAEVQFVRRRFAGLAGDHRGEAFAPLLLIAYRRLARLEQQTVDLFHRAVADRLLDRRGQVTRDHVRGGGHAQCQVAPPTATTTTSATIECFQLENHRTASPPPSPRPCVESSAQCVPVGGVLGHQHAAVGQLRLPLSVARALGPLHRADRVTAFDALQRLVVDDQLLALQPQPDRPRTGAAAVEPVGVERRRLRAFHAFHAVASFDAFDPPAAPGITGPCRCRRSRPRSYVRGVLRGALLAGHPGLGIAIHRQAHGLEGRMRAVVHRGERPVQAEGHRRQQPVLQREPGQRAEAQLAGEGQVVEGVVRFQSRFLNRAVKKGPTSAKSSR